MNIGNINIDSNSSVFPKNDKKICHILKPAGMPQASHWDLKVALRGYLRCNLESMENSKLMNRVDTKYILPRSYLYKLLHELQGKYCVLDINGEQVFTYENQYYDTEDFEFFRKHHNGKQNRYKVRSRSYLETGSSFLEVKFKNNKSRTIKKRIEIASDDSDKSNQVVFLQNQFEDYGLEALIKSQYSVYNRLTLVNEVSQERVTLDFNLSYKKGENDPYEVKLDNLCIAELKQGNKNIRSDFAALMRRYCLQPISFSKYCIGCSLLYPQTLKSNRFKPILREINRIAGCQ